MLARLRRLSALALPATATAFGYLGRAVGRYGLPVGGAAALTVGVAQVYAPAGWITAGVLVLADSVVDDVRAARAVRDAHRQKGGAS